MNFPIKNTLTINLPAGKQAGKVPFGDQPTIRGRKIRSIVSRIGVNASDKTSSGNLIASNLANAFISLVTAAGETIHDFLPLSLLDPAKNNGQMQEISGQVIDWNKCFVTYPGWVAGDATAEIPLLIIYE